MKEEELLEEARERFKMRSDDELDNKNSFEEDMKFAFNIDSGQWSDEDISDRDAEKRPHLTANKLGKFVALVVNAEKGQPSLDEVIPVDDQGDILVAQIYNEIINHVEYQSEADEVYALAGEHAVGGGFGFWRIITEYSDDSFDQEIKIKPIKNPLMVSVDPDGDYAFIREVMSKKDFEKKWPKKDGVNFESSSGGDDYELWYEDERVFIAEYFKKEYYMKEIVEYLHPETGIPIVTERTKENADLVDRFEIKRRRTMQSHKIKWYKISGSEILEEGEWPGSEIPIIEVAGHEVHLVGKTYKKSLITDAKDAQRAYNYWYSSITEKVALSPKAPYLVTDSQIKGHEPYWREANRKNFPYLKYNPTGAGVPQRALPTPVDSGAMTLLSLADSNIKDILGMYESSLGMASNERSGKAIQARAARSDMGTYSFQENLRKAKQKTKKMLIEIIPIIYDNERVIRLRGEDSQIRINYNELDENQRVVKINDLNRGKYDLRVRTTGTPSRRQQTVDNILQAMQYAGPYGPQLLPMFFEHLDAPGSDEIKQVIMQAVQQQQAQEQQPKK